MAVVNIPPDNRIYNLGRIQSQLHVYNTNNPAAPNTLYNLTIPNVSNWMNRNILPGHTDTYAPAGNAVYIQNQGPSRLQVLYVDTALTPEEAGLEVVGAMPEPSES